MVTAILGMAFGLVLLIGGAEAVVRGASAMATRLGVSPLVIGLTVVAFGTSAPEMALSMAAAARGAAGIAIGNVVGSNSFNAALILGVAALICPLSVHTRLLKVDLPVAAVSAAALLALAANGVITRVEGAVLAVGFAVYLSWLVVESRRYGGESVLPAPAAGGGAPGASVQAVSGRTVALLLVVGFAALIGGSRLFLDAAVRLATMLGVSDAVIGLTVAAAGTSLPELAASAVAARRGQADIAIGNIVGSNSFNALAITGAAALVRPLSLSGVGWGDLWFMMGVTLVLFPLMYTGLKVTRWEGALLVVAYCAYAWCVIA